MEGKRADAKARIVDFPREIVVFPWTGGDSTTLSFFLVGNSTMKKS